jgi:hypothetical protein
MCPPTATYRDSLTSRRPKQDDSPASFISGEKDILSVSGPIKTSVRERARTLDKTYSSISSWPDT